MSKIQITIEADSVGEFKATLAALLGTTTIQTINVSSDNPDAVAGKVAEAAKAKTPAATKAATAKPAGPKLVDPATEFAETPTDGNPKAEAKAEPKSEPVKEKPKAKTTPAPDTQAAGGGPELPENIKNTNSMRDLLTYLAEHGVDSADAMVATCTVLKKDVPILSKVPNVEERVRRALDVLALFPAPEAETAQA